MRLLLVALLALPAACGRSTSPPDAGTDASTVLYDVSARLAIRPALAPGTDGWRLTASDDPEQIDLAALPDRLRATSTWPADPGITIVVPHHLAVRATPAQQSAIAEDLAALNRHRRRICVSTRWIEADPAVIDRLPWQRRDPLLSRDEPPVPTWLHLDNQVVERGLRGVEGTTILEGPQLILLPGQAVTLERTTVTAWHGLQVMLRVVPTDRVYFTPTVDLRSPGAERSAARSALVIPDGGSVALRPEGQPRTLMVRAWTYCDCCRATS
jgi:hypothetical protein